MTHRCFHRHVARLGTAIAAVALLVASTGPAAAQVRPLALKQLIRCADTSFETNYGGYYTGSAECEHEVEACGGDPLDRGDIRVFPAGRMHVVVDGANAWNLYEVYWHPLAGDPTDAATTIMVGNFLTDGTGHTDADLIDIAAPADATSGAWVDFKARVGTTAVGHFLVFSRGPYGSDSDGDGVLSSGEYNTSDGTAAGTVHDPVIDLACGRVQFVSGLKFPGGFGKP